MLDLIEQRALGSTAELTFGRFYRTVRRRSLAAASSSPGADESGAAGAASRDSNVDIASIMALKTRCAVPTPDRADR